MSRRKQPKVPPRAVVPAPASKPSGAMRRRWRPLLVAVALGAVAVIAIWAWRREPTPGPPPELAPGRAEPVVAQAIDSARAAVLADLRRADAWGELGMLFAAHAYWSEAAECYATAHRLDRSDARWAYLLGVYHSTIDAAAAIPFLEMAVADRPPSPEHEATARCKLGETYLLAGRPGDAERMFRELLAKVPADPRAALGLGQAMLAVGKTAEAIDPLTIAGRTAAGRKRATALLATAARSMNDQPAATAYEHQAAELPDDPEWPDPFVKAVIAWRVSSKLVLDQVAALEREGRVAETIPLLERIAREQPTSQVLVKLGTNLVEINQPAAAEKQLREAIRLEPEAVQGHFFLGLSLYFQAKAAGTPAARREAQYREAMDEFRRATELKPDHAIAFAYRGECLKALGDRSGAIESFRKAVESRPEVPDLQLALVEALLDDGRTPEATAQFREAERVVPANHPRLVKLRERLGLKP